MVAASRYLARFLGVLRSHFEPNLIRWAALIVTVACCVSKADAQPIRKSLALEQWSEIAPSGTLPPPRRDCALAYDSRRDQLVVIGGANGGNGTWLLNLAGTPQWTDVAGPSPLVVSDDDHAVYDRVNDRVVVVDTRMDAWSLSMANPVEWSIMPTTSPPPARRYFASAYDVHRNRLLIFGGMTEQYEVLNDVWALPLSGPPIWTRILGQGQAIHRWGATAVFDPVRDQLIITAGSATNGYATTNDLWALSMEGTPTWTSIATPSSPPPRMFAPAIYDPAGDRVLLHDGYNRSDGNAYADVWALSLSPPAWTQLSPTGIAPYPRWSHRAIYRYGPTVTSAMILFSGFNGFGPGLWRNDTWSLELASITVDVPPPSVYLTMRAASPISDGRIVVQCSLRDHSPARLELVDVAGRVLHAQAVGALGPGPHVLDLAGTGPIPTGLYFIRLQQGGSEVRQRVAILK